MPNIQRKSITSSISADCRVPRPEADEIRLRIKSAYPVFSRLQYRLWSWHETSFRTNGPIYQPVVCSILFHGCHLEVYLDRFVELHREGNGLHVSLQCSFINLSNERLIDHMRVTVDRDGGDSYRTERSLVSTGT